MQSIGRKVPYAPLFKPRDLNYEMALLPLRLSKRIGIRSIGVVSGKRRLHPDYVCWYNSCEKCGDWTLESPGTCSLDTVDFQENIGSLLFSQGASINIPSLAAGCLYTGFWLKFESADGIITIDVGVLTDAPGLGGYAKVEFAQTSPANLTFQNVFRTPDSFWSGSKYDYTAHVGYWRWWEILAYWQGVPNQSNFVVRRNGVEVGGSATLLGNVGTYVTLKKDDVYSHRSMKFDYVRVANKWEYPPA